MKTLLYYPPNMSDPHAAFVWLLEDGSTEEIPYNSPVLNDYRPSDLYSNNRDVVGKPIAVKGVPGFYVLKHQPQTT